MFDNNLRQIRIILYRLKRSYGLPARIKRPTRNDYDITTGAITREYLEIPIRRVIVLPTNDARKFAYDLAFIAANKNFTYGGFFDKNTRNMIIDVKDLPRGFVLSSDDHLVFEDRAYAIKDFQLAEHNQGYLLTVTEIESTDSEPVVPPVSSSGSGS